MSSYSPKREFDIDWFRGLVCLCLAILHFYNSSLYDAYYRLFGDTGTYIIWNCRLGVESFFVLAGFMMAHMLRPVPGEQVSILGYLKRRFFRLIIPYWIAVLLFASARWGFKLMTGRGDDMPMIGDVLAQLGFVQEFVIDPSRQEKVIPAGFWSMVTLEQFYLIWLGMYGLCLGLFGRGTSSGYGRAERAMMFLTFAAGLGSLSFWVLGYEHQVKMQLLLFGVYLSLGMMLYWAVRQNLGQIYLQIAVVCILAATVYMLAATPYTGTAKLMKSLLVVAIFIPLARGAMLPRNAAVRFLSFCGKRSYSIYLMHAIAGIFFLNLTWKLTNKSDWFALPLTVAAIGVSLVAAIIFFRYVEVPCQERARQVAYRTKREKKVELVKPASRIVEHV